MLQLEPGSFRDRTGRVFYEGSRVLRGLSQQSLQSWEMLARKEFFQSALKGRSIVKTRHIPDHELPADWKTGTWAGILEHERIPYISYPYEWCFGMLRDAALLTLKLLAEAVQEEMILKDSSAYNIQWRGLRPTFIDIPSFEPLEPGQPWTGYRQFCQLFLYPLLLQAYRNIDFQPLLRGSLDGITAEQCDSMMSWRDRLRSGVLTHVYLQSRFQRRYRAERRDVRKQLQSAGFRKEWILRNVGGLKRIIEKLRWQPSDSTWVRYGDTHSYSGDDHQLKADFVKEATSVRFWPLTWDLGCNDGRFTRLAAANSGCTVAIDSDAPTIERLYWQLQKEPDSGEIVPLVVDLADPSPALGWQGTERKNLPARGKPDLILFLALVHHLVISANIPLEELIGWLSGLGGHLIIEFVSREDPMVKTLLRNKPDQYGDYQEDHFRKGLKQHYEILRQQPLLNGQRWLFFARPRSTHAADRQLVDG